MSISGDERCGGPVLSRRPSQAQPLLCRPLCCVEYVSRTFKVAIARACHTEVAQFPETNSTYIRGTVFLDLLALVVGSLASHRITSHPRILASSHHPSHLRRSHFHLQEPASHPLHYQQHTPSAPFLPDSFTCLYYNVVARPPARTTRTHARTHVRPLSLPNARLPQAVYSVPLPTSDPARDHAAFGYQIAPARRRLICTRQSRFA